MLLTTTSSTPSAIAAHQFHVYDVATVEEGIRALTGVPAGVADSAMATSPKAPSSAPPKPASSASTKPSPTISGEGRRDYAT